MNVCSSCSIKGRRKLESCFRALFKELSHYTVDHILEDLLVLSGNLLELLELFRRYYDLLDLIFAISAAFSSSSSRHVKLHFLNGLNTTQGPERVHHLMHGLCITDNKGLLLPRFPDGCETLSLGLFLTRNWHS